MSQAPFDRLFDQFKDIRVGVIGDVMLDTYMWGKVERISPEAPVPIVTLHRKDYRIGGAGNVALNLQSLGANVSLLSMIGDDDDGRALKNLLDAGHIDTTYLFPSTDRITTNKIRVISRNQQMMRLDNEITSDLTATEEQRLLGAVSAYLDTVKPQVLIFEDYNKGLLTEGIIKGVIAACRDRKVITAADPKRRHFFTYRHVDIFKPNLKEVRDSLNLLDEEPTLVHLEQIHEALHDQLSHGVSLITLSEKGVFYHDATSGHLIPSHIRNVADVSGAGDTVIAVAALVYAATRDTHLMASIANIAGGLVCEEVGTAAIRKEQLLEECKLLLP